MADITKKKFQHSARYTQPLPVACETQTSTDSTLARLQSERRGLTSRQVEERLKQNGLNQVAHEKAPPAMIQLMTAFNNPFIYILTALASISFFTDYWLPARQGEATDLTGVTIMTVMVLLSGIIRFWQEFRTNKSADALKSLVRTQVMTLRRCGENSEPRWLLVSQQQLVPGDILSLSTGDIIPADVKLITSKNLLINQAALSGEAMPVEKFCFDQPHSPACVIGETALFDLPDICLMGTHVAGGHATAVVVATGEKSWFGSLAKSITGKRPLTAFDRGVNSVSWLLIKFMFVMVPIVLFINGLTKGDWLDATLFAVAVAVGLTPEMLPMIVNANLAKGAMVMARRKVVVKRLNTIQDFGAMDVLCTDKTGTLTEDHISLEHPVDLTGHFSRQVLDLAWLNSFHQLGRKDLMDCAVLEFANKIGDLPLDMHKIDELAFDFTRRRQSVLLGNDQGEQQLICKGAIEEMLAISTHMRLNGQTVALDQCGRNQILAQAATFNQQGYRVLLVATRYLRACNWQKSLIPEDEKNMTLYGMLTFRDPIKKEAAEAIRTLRENGIKIKILTGDRPLIATRICQELNLDAGEPLTGDEIAALNNDQLMTKLRQHTVFARLTPSQKQQIVTLLQKDGHTVGYLGDGINDAPALRAADIGISVESGTDIAKASADIILLEKSLTVLKQGVITGRQTFGNIIKYLNITASSNFGNVFSVLVASAFIPFLPILAIQLLLLNLIYDFSQLALPWDKMDKEFLRKPRQWNTRNIGRFMLFMGPVSSLFDITTFALMWYIFSANSIESQALFQSGWFIESLLSQTLVVHMLRTRKIPFFQSCASWPIMMSTVMVCMIGIGLPFSPVSSWFGLQPLPLSYFPWLVATLVSYCILSQIVKKRYIEKFGQWF